MPELSVLVVEDEPLIRLDVVDTFERAGCTTIVVATAEEAVGAVLEYPSLGALFPHITLPGHMDGLELAHVVKRLRPKAKIFLSSGTTLPRKGDLPEGARFIAKTGAVTRNSSGGLRRIMTARVGSRPCRSTTAGRCSPSSLRRRIRSTCISRATSPIKLLAACEKLGLEGIVSKRRNSANRPGPTKE